MHCGWGRGTPALKGPLSWLDVLRAGLLPPAAFPAAGSTQFLISTNGRKGGSRQQPARAYTYLNEPLGHQSLIDYFLMPLSLYNCCTSHFNLFLHNKTLATSHALMLVTLRDDLLQPMPEPSPPPPPAPAAATAIAGEKGKPVPLCAR